MTTTVRVLAKAAGGAHTTVSWVRNGSGKVRESTRERVLTEAARLNYTPHHAARALATRRTQTIGALIPTMESSLFAPFIGGLETALFTLLLTLASMTLWAARHDGGVGVPMATEQIVPYVKTLRSEREAAEERAREAAAEAARRAALAGDSIAERAE